MHSATNSATRKAADATEMDARKFIALAAGLRYNVPSDIRPEECGAWQPHAEDLIRAAEQGGSAAVEVGLDVLKRDYTAVVEAVRESPIPRKTHYTTAELLSTDFRPPVCVVPGLFFEGLNLLGGRPKLGKSWLALQIALAVATGGKVFGEDVQQGNVLYLALEDNEARLKGRMLTQGWTAAAHVDFHVIWPLLAEGGLDQLRDAVAASEYRLIIIDTASRFLGGKIDQMDPGATNDTFGALQQMALLSHAAVLMLDHHRKPNAIAPDPVDDILGSTGKAAPADAILGLYRQRGKSEATLMLTGRELVETSDLALRWDAVTCSWQCVGKAGDVARGSVQDEILETMKEWGGMGTVSELAHYLGKKGPNIHREMAELVALGKVVKAPDKQGRNVPYLIKPPKTP